MFRRTALRFVNAVRRRPASSMVVMGLIGASVAATAIAATEQTGGPITAVKLVRDRGGVATISSSYEDVPGATTTITVPSGQRALILARFEANSDCPASATSGCSGYVRILIGGVEGAPATTSVFDSAEELPAGTPGIHGTPGTHSVERSRGGFGGLPAGTYQVKVQYRVDQGQMTLSDWHLTVERSQTG